MATFDPANWGIDPDDYETATPDQRLAMVSVALTRTAEERDAAQKAQETGIAFKTSAYPGAIEVTGLQLGWKSIRTDAHKVRALVAAMSAFEHFVSTHKADIKQDAADMRFERARTVKKAEDAEKKKKTAAAA